MTRPDNAQPWWTKRPEAEQIPGQEALFKDANGPADDDFDTWMRKLAAQGGQARTAPQAGETPANTSREPQTGDPQ